MNLKKIKAVITSNPVLYEIFKALMIVLGVLGLLITIAILIGCYIAYQLIH